MQEHLCRILTERYPALYGQVKGGQGYAFAVHDGWFGILDALSTVLVWRAELDGRSPKPVRQVKEKYGTLRYYFGDGEADEGAIDMSEEISARLCEVTGRPGRLGDRSGWWATRAPGLDGLTFVQTTFDSHGRMGVPALHLTAADVMRWRADVLAEPSPARPVLEVPVGWLDLADGLLRCLARGKDVIRSTAPGVITLKPSRSTLAASLPVRVNRIGVGASGSMHVEYVGGGRIAGGVVAMAIELSRRMDPFTGAIELF